MHKLEVDSIQLSFEEKKILSDIYLKCETGKLTGLLGRNGSGKSCLMKIVYGSLACEKSVRFDNENTKAPFKNIHLLTYLPQFNFIPKNFTIKKVFEDYALDFEDFMKIFEEFKTVQSQKMEKLSGGEKRLVELYVVIKSKSKFSMLDEPFSNLSPIQIEKVKALLNFEKTNKGFLITDHLYRHILAISDTLYVLKNGKTYLTKNIEDIERLGYLQSGNS